MLSWLAEPFAYGFFARAVAAGVLVGTLCGAISVFVVLRRMSYIGHGLAHSVLGGVAVALALDRNLYVGAAVATLVSAFLIDRVSRRPGLHADAAIGVVTTAMFAVGVAVIALIGGVRVNTESLLFGNVLGVGRADLLLAAAVAALFALVVVRYYKPLLFSTFDPAVAAVQGVRVGAMELLFNVLVAAVVIVSVRVLGVLMIAAAVVIPGATARLLCRSFHRMLLTATLIGAGVSVVGLYGSYYVDVPSGATIVLAGAAVFVLASVGTTAATRRRSQRARRRHAAPVGEPVAVGTGPTLSGVGDRRPSTGPRPRW